jgi:predicted nucleotidyltransferase component of viral defense system
LRLHEQSVDFADLSVLAATWMGLPIAALTRDYYIVMMLLKLERSEFAATCVFKGGTSLSTCFPGSIERFSEDIDLTFVPYEQLTPTQYERQLKRIETIMSDGFRLEKIIPSVLLDLDEFWSASITYFRVKPVAAPQAQPVGFSHD